MSFGSENTHDSRSGDPVMKLWSQVSTRRIRSGAIAVLIAVGPALPSAAAAQALQLRVEQVPAGIEIEVVARPYTIRGSSVAELGTQMRTLGLGGVATFPYFFQWTYQAEETRTRFANTPSGQCRIRDLGIQFDVTANYPEWESSASVPGELVEAWRSFQDLITRRWEERRRGIVEYAREITRQLRRIEVGCPLLRGQVQEAVERLRDQSSGAAREAAASGERVVLQWPPPGYESLMRAGAAAPTPSAASTPVPAPARTSDAAPPPIPLSLDEALQMDRRSSGTFRVVAGFLHLGEIRFLQAFGTDDSLSAETAVDFPAFADVLVGTLAAALERDGVLDLQAPLATYLEGGSPRIGAVTLEQLLSHRSGLQSAAPGVGPAQAIAALDDQALFAEPGAVYSYSINDYQLVAQAIESATGASLADLVNQMIIAPAGMENTSFTSPIPGPAAARTSGYDLLRFATAWLAGDFRGAEVGDGAALARSDGARAFAAGTWHDRIGTQPRSSLLCEAAGGPAVGFEIFPETSSAVVFVGSSWPTNTARFVLNQVATELGVGAEIFEPRRLRGTGSLYPQSGPCSEPDWNDVTVVEAGEPAAAGDWAGRYSNGARRFLLEDREGSLVASPFEQPLPVTHYSMNTYFALVSGRALFPLLLIRDLAGRRYVVLGDRAYLHDEDRPAN